MSSCIFKLTYTEYSSNLEYSSKSDVYANKHLLLGYQFN